MTRPHADGRENETGQFGELMAEVMTGAARFGHREHVHLTWLTVRRFGTPAAVRLVSEGIQRTARYAGAPQKYHATMSRAWVELVGFHIASDGERYLPGRTDALRHWPGRTDALRHWPGRTDALRHWPGRTNALRHWPGRTDALGPGADSFAAFADRHPALLNKRLLIRHYRPATLASRQARTGWVEPDLAPFPWQASRG